MARKSGGKGKGDSATRLANTAFLGSIIVFAIGGFFYVVVSPSADGQVPLDEAGAAAEVCVAKCEDFLASGGDPSRSTCLMNPISGSPGWVCDIVHSPRTGVDEDPRNQCSTFVSGAARHFVEVSTKCELIRVG